MGVSIVDINALTYGPICEANWKRNLAEMGCFTPEYTFYSDISAAEYCQLKLNEKNAIEKSYNEFLKSWGNNYKALTEIVMVINHKSWAFNSPEGDGSLLNITEKERIDLCEFYSDLYYKADEEFRKRFGDNDEAMGYYFEVTD